MREGKDSNSIENAMFENCRSDDEGQLSGKRTWLSAIICVLELLFCRCSGSRWRRTVRCKIDQFGAGGIEKLPPRKRRTKECQFQHNGPARWQVVYAGGLPENKES